MENYLPISMWLLTLIALAIIIATTASAITIIICFPSQSLWSRRIFGLLFYMLSFSIFFTWNLPSPVLEISHLLYIYIRLLICILKISCFIFTSAKVMPFFWIRVTNGWQNDERKWFFDVVLLGSLSLDTGQLLSVSYFTYFRISLLFLPFLAGSGINPW